MLLDDLMVNRRDEMKLDIRTQANPFSTAVCCHICSVSQEKVKKEVKAVTSCDQLPCFLNRENGRMSNILGIKYS